MYINRPVDLYIIGCGGVGGYITNMLPMNIASLSLDALDALSENSPNSRLITSESVLNSEVFTAIPLVVNKLVLIDGDTFDNKNTIRQANKTNIHGGKVAQRISDINGSILRNTYLQNLKIFGFNKYINPGNIEKIITKKGTIYEYSISPDNKSIEAPIPVVFLCVDNKKTRYEVFKYMETFDDCLVLNGGNDKLTGHVTVYERSNGIALDPTLYELYPEIKDPDDLRPDEVECGVVAAKHDQIAITNSIIANIMLACFNRWFRIGLYEIKNEKINVDKRKNEILIDTNNMSMMCLNHKKKEV